MQTFEFEATGTKWSVSLPEGAGPNLKAEVINLVKTFESKYSRFNGTVISELQTLGTHTLPEDAKPLFDIYKDFTTITNGYFSPFMGKTLEDLGYDKTLSFIESGHVTKPMYWDEVVGLYDFPKISLKEHVVFDFGAAGKGYVIDLVCKLLDTQSVEEYVVEAGGDMKHKGNSVIKVGLENPSDTSTAIGVATVGNMSICGSSGSRRKWNNHHHIINPLTLKSPDKVVATWVVSNDAIVANAIATSLFFVEPYTFETHSKFEYVILNLDGTVEVSKNFNGEIFYAK